MTKTVTILLILLPPLLLLGASRNINPGDEAPNFSLQDTSGAEFSLASLKGKIVIVLFWKAEQKRSIEALTALQAIYTKLKEESVAVLALSSDEGGLQLIDKTKQSKKHTFPMLYDRGTKAYGR